MYRITAPESSMCCREYRRGGRSIYLGLRSKPLPHKQGTCGLIGGVGALCFVLGGQKGRSGSNGFCCFWSSLKQGQSEGLAYVGGGERHTGLLMTINDDWLNLWIVSIHFLEKIYYAESVSKSRIGRRGIHLPKLPPFALVDKAQHSLFVRLFV